MCVRMARKIQTMARIEPALRKAAEDLAKDENRSLSNLIESALKEYVERKRK